MNESVLTVTGIAKPNKGNGRKFGYPTANISCPTDLEEGVFIGFSTIKFNEIKYDTMPSIIFIGNPETLNESGKRLETHILDIPDEDLYGAQVTVELAEKIRINRKFDSIEELIDQMRLDETYAREYFGAVS
jgi:riboflavin kinase/FMN adenylyltransferase